eukprot:scaffold62094_cov19-Tisochrysis_lutea.AAC.2
MRTGGKPHLCSALERSKLVPGASVLPAHTLCPAWSWLWSCALSTSAFGCRLPSLAPLAGIRGGMGGWIPSSVPLGGGTGS